MHRLCLMISIVLSFAVFGCDNEPEDETDCSYVQDPCSILGDLRCSETGRTIEVCELNMDFCNHWGTEQTCGSNQHCDGGSNPVCVCDDGCDSDGASRCEDTLIMICRVDGVGCYYWATEANCGEGGGTCEESDGEASCSRPCEDQCAPVGASRCNADVIQNCEVGGEGCYVWVASTDCSGENGTCVESDGTATCDYACTNECSTAGQTRCVGEVIETCGLGDGECLEWIPGTDCSSSVPPQFCSTGEEGAECTDECEDRCLAEDDRGCNLDAVSICQTNEFGCLDWVIETDCTIDVPPMVCDETGAEPICVLACDDMCPTDGDSRCLDDGIQSCSLIEATGCLDWLTGADCTALEPAQVCDDGSGTAACVLDCTPNCTTGGALQCTGSTIEECAMGDLGCLEWTLNFECADNVPPQTCDDASGTPTCSDSCTPDCDTEGAYQCLDDILQICSSGTGCRQWTDYEDCAANIPAQICDDAVTPECVDCTPDCTVEGATQCAGDILQVCSADSGCLMWTTQDDCSDNDPPGTCDDAGTPTCVCASNCATEAELRCNEDILEVCSTVATDCLQWTMQDNCADNIPAQTCVDTECVE